MSHYKKIEEEEEILSTESTLSVKPLYSANLSLFGRKNSYGPLKKKTQGNEFSLLISLETSIFPGKETLRRGANIVFVIDTSENGG